MAGDIFIQNISTAEIGVLQAAGAVLIQTIQHANRPWANYQNRLAQQLQPGTPNNRVNLPAHAYIRFNGGNQGAVSLYTGQSATNKTKLRDVLLKTSRPLGLVAANPNLTNWPANAPTSAESMLTTAMALGNVTLEFYQVDGTDLLTKYPGWAMVNEH